MKTPINESSHGPQSLMKDERGLSTVEYVILLVLIAAACIGLWVTFGGKMQQKIRDANTEMDKVEVSNSDPDSGGGG